MNIEIIEQYALGLKIASPDFTPVLITDTNLMSKVKKKRLIHVPNESMEKLHDAFVKHLRPRIINKMPSACGGVEGQSVITTLAKHKASDGKFHRYFYALDLSKAYHQVNVDQLANILYKKVDENFFLSVEETKNFLWKYCLKAPTPGLVMGGGASPDLFNIYCEHMVDQTLRQLVAGYDITYTRYIDDLLFSSDKPIGRGKRQLIRSIIVDADLLVEEKKSHVYDLEKNPVIINGITIKIDGTMSIPGAYLRKIQGIIHRARVYGDVDIRRVSGMVNMLKQVVKGREMTSTEKKCLESFQLLKQTIPIPLS